MSKNIIIQEGGIGKQLTADKLKTNLVGSGSCLWVPEDETQLGTKYISENGTYKASDDGLYGYSEVTVSGIGTATGKDSDGDNAQASVDPGTGEIVTTKLIDSIAVTNPPTKTTYQNGESIDFSGLVVHGYSSTGKDLGAIPLNKLSIQPTVAAYDSSTASSTAESDIIDGAVSFGGALSTRSENELAIYDYSVTGASAYITGLKDGIFMWLAAAGSSVTITDHRTTTIKSTGAQETITSTQKLYTNYTHNNKTVYYHFVNGRADESLMVTPSPWDGLTNSNGAMAAWTVIYGEIESLHSTMTVNVSYSGSDTGGNTVETSFTISVTPGMGGATGGGGQAGDTGTGRND